MTMGSRVGTLPRMAPPGTRLRNLRVDDDLWLAAKARAEEEGTDLSSVIRSFLRAYVVGTEEKKPS